MKFVPLGDRVLVRRTDEEETSEGGIVLPGSAAEKPSQGEVLAVGPGKITDDGKRIPMELKVGDSVVYSKYAGTEYKVGEIEYLVLREDDILFVK